MAVLEIHRNHITDLFLCMLLLGGPDFFPQGHTVGSYGHIPFILCVHFEGSISQRLYRLPMAERVGRGTPCLL